MKQVNEVALVTGVVTRRRVLKIGYIGMQTFGDWGTLG